jgi:DNA-binding NarL/FixJ family response regulator
MALHVAVVDPVPVYRRGMLAVLLGDGGFEAETPEDVLAWIRQGHDSVVLLTVQGRREWSLLAELHRANPDLILVAVLPKMSTEAHARALLAGAVAAIARDAPLDLIRSTVEAAIKGTSSVPREVLQTLIQSQESQPERLPVSAQEVEWLRTLAQGVTVAQLAEQSSYSERAMYRLLRSLYSRLGVNGRTEALMVANRHGWL